jgi:transposase
VPEELDDAALERKLFAPAGYNPPRSKPLPEWGHIHAELRRRGVTFPKAHGARKHCRHRLA